MPARIPDRDPPRDSTPALREPPPLLRDSVPSFDALATHIDPPRVVPLLGPVQLHHAHYRCTVYYTKVTNVGWPIPHRLVDEDCRECLYIDHDHYHMVGNVDLGAPGAEQ